MTQHMTQHIQIRLITANGILCLKSTKTDHNPNLEVSMKKEDPHKGCPNRGHCKKDETKCCYLVSHNNKCYLELDNSEAFI